MPMSGAGRFDPFGVPPERLAAPVPIIFDNDFAGDVDGMVALALLVKLARLGEASVYGIISTNDPQYELPCARAFCDHYGISSTYGARAGSVTGAGTYDKAVVDAFGSIPGDVRDNYPSALTTYRTLLAAAADNSVVIVCAGALTNMQDLLNSGADGISTLAGPQLVAQKVRRMVFMGGDHPSAATGSGNWGFNAQTQAAAYATFQNMPRSIEILVVGYTMGADVYTGLPGSVSQATNPLKLALNLWFAANAVSDPPGFRSSWDVLALLAGVRGTQYFGTPLLNGRIVVPSDGSMTEDTTVNYRHIMLNNLLATTAIATVINDLLLALGDS